MSALTPEAKYKKLRRAGEVVPPDLVRERNGILAQRKKEIKAGANKNTPGSKREYDDRAHRLGVIRTQRHRAKKKAEKAAEKAAEKNTIDSVLSAGKLRATKQKIKRE